MTNHKNKWTPYDGKGCPVDKNKMVCIFLDDGEKVTLAARDIDWESLGEKLIAYMVLN